MDMVMTNDFAEMSSSELIDIEGGSRDAARAILLIGGALSMGIGAPVGGILGGPAGFGAFYSGGMILLAKGVKG